MSRIAYPFTAIVGQEKAKSALIYSLINPEIGGVLLCGEKGTAKSTMVRALSHLNQKKIVELPLSVTEDRLIGGIDLEAAIKTGNHVFSPGLLQEADKGILYADEVNLLPYGIVNVLLDVMESGINHVEREGISHIHEARFSLIGTMNPEEGALRPQLLDRFGLYVAVGGEQEIKCRKEIVKRLLTFEENPMAFCLSYQESENALLKRIKSAKERLNQVEIGESEYVIACELADSAGAAGHRAQLAILHTAMAIAAWQGRTYIQLNDLQEAAELALPHRKQEKMRPQKPQVYQQDSESPSQEDRQTQHPKEQSESSAVKEYEDLDSGLRWEQDQERRESEALEQVAQGENLYGVRMLANRSRDRIVRRGNGRRNKTVSATQRGRYIRATFPHGKVEDIAIDATLRTAATKQFRRRQSGQGLVILPSDLRMKVRESRVGADIIFAVDASGSMGVAKRMKETKEAVLSLLMDAYQRRDRVGLIAFRKDSAKVLLPLTRSVELAKRELQCLPTGGRTPLAQGLGMAHQLILGERRKNKESLPLLVVITDGRANYRVGDGDAIEEALQEARSIAKNHIQAIAIDTERQFITLGLAKTLADEMGAVYYKVDELKAKELSALIRGFSPIERNI